MGRSPSSSTTTWATNLSNNLCAYVSTVLLSCSQKEVNSMYRDVYGFQRWLDYEPTRSTKRMVLNGIHFPFIPVKKCILYDIVCIYTNLLMERKIYQNDKYRRGDSFYVNAHILFILNSFVIDSL